MNRLAALAVLLVASTASAGRGALVLVPPAEVDVGAGAPVGAATVGSSTEVLAGIHWASLYWHPTHFDIGFGYVGSFRQVLPDYSARMIGAQGTSELSLNGAYLSLGYAIESHEHWRTWLGARIETLDASVGNESFPVLGEAVRVATEVYTSGAAAAGDHSCIAMVAGALSVGVYVEAVHRNLPPELGPNGVTAGVSMRIPFLFAAAN